MKRKRGRPRKGEERPPKDKTRLERQAAGDMTLEQMLDDLPKNCDRGAKVNAQGFRNAWVGYKFHIDAIDTGIPVVCILTSASVHDSQVAIPLANITGQRITFLYECMDVEKHARMTPEEANRRLSLTPPADCRNSFSSCNDGKATSDDLHRKDWDGSSLRAGPAAAPPHLSPLLEGGRSWTRIGGHR